MILIVRSEWVVSKQNHEINWRKSLVPAPAVIPAPIAYIIDVAVETFVVELFLLKTYVCHWHICSYCRKVLIRLCVSHSRFLTLYFEWIGVFHAGFTPCTIYHSISRVWKFPLLFRGIFDTHKNGWGHSYSTARGEILWLVEDEPLRKHLPRTFLLIKNES